jgi:hypothetical protein
MPCAICNSGEAAGRLTFDGRSLDFCQVDFDFVRVAATTALAGE